MTARRAWFWFHVANALLSAIVAFGVSWGINVHLFGRL
jgi:hypothetical protein